MRFQDVKEILLGLLFAVCMALILLVLVRGITGQELRAMPKVRTMPSINLGEIMPTGVRWYKPTQYSQRQSNTNGVDTIMVYHRNRDDVWADGTLLNPNRLFPWATNGGLDGLRANGKPGVYLPGPVQVWQERTQTAAGGPLPKWRWRFPIGTVFVDALSSDGKVFEVRQREKKVNGWASSTLYRSERHKPTGYKGPGKACAECHDKAGASLQYGITVRGGDGVFSWSPFVEGKKDIEYTLSLRSDWPIERK